MKRGKHWLITLIAAVQLMPHGTAHAQYADQEAPMHGGVTNWNTNSEFSFELVAKQRAVTLYIEDHDGPVLSAGAKGTLVISHGGSSKTVTLTPAGGNRLVARDVSIATSDRVVATVTLANGSIMMGRFVFR